LSDAPPRLVGDAGRRVLARAERKASILSAKILDKLQRPLADMPEVSDNEDTDDHGAEPIPDDTHSKTIENDPVNDEENEITEKSDE
jgi:hypothetical protein